MIIYHTRDNNIVTHKMSKDMRCNLLEVVTAGSGVSVRGTAVGRLSCLRDTRVMPAIILLFQCCFKVITN